MFAPESEPSGEYASWKNIVEPIYVAELLKVLWSTPGRILGDFGNIVAPMLIRLISAQFRAALQF